MLEVCICNCGAKNFVDLGDPHDPTKPDVEAYKCHNCGECSWLCDEEDFIELMVEEYDNPEIKPEETYCVDGISKDEL